MAFSKEQEQKGIVMLNLLEDLGSKLSSCSITLFKGTSRSSFNFNVHHHSLNIPISIGLFIKTSNRRHSPWKYSFHKQHQEEIHDLERICDHIYVVFVNGRDGIICLDRDMLRSILDTNFEEVENVSISRKLNQYYRVKGRDGKLEKPIPRNTFPDLIIEFIKNRIQ